MTQERRNYTEEDKAQAVGRVLMGETSTAVAQSLGVPPETVRTWLHRSKTAVSAVETVSTKERFGALILDYLATGIGTLKTQADVLGDPTFLRSEGGQIFAVAQAHRLTADNIARYLAAIDFGNA